MRIWLPFLYLIQLENNSSFYYILILSHTTYLMISLFVCYIMVNNLRYIRVGNIKISNQGRRFIYLLLIYGLLILLFLNKNLPVFNSGGSDAIVRFNQESRLNGLLLSSLYLPIIGCVILIFAGSRSGFLLIFLIILLTAAGKKAGVLGGVHLLVLLVLVTRKVPKFVIGSLPFLPILAVGFAVYQLIGSSSQARLTTLLFFDNIFNLMDIIQISASLFLIQLFDWGGLVYLESYMHKESAYDYFFNPFHKVLGTGGVDKMLGPYLNYKLFGSEIPNGSNMTFPIELYALGGSLPMIMASLLSVPLMMVSAYFVRFRREVSTLTLILLCIFYQFFTFAYPDLVNGYIYLIFNLFTLTVMFIVYSLLRVCLNRNT